MVTTSNDLLDKQEILDKLEEIKKLSNCQENFLEALGEFLNNNPKIDDTCERWYNTQPTILRQRLFSIDNLLHEWKKNTRQINTQINRRNRILPLKFLSVPKNIAT